MKSLAIALALTTALMGCAQKAKDEAPALPPVYNQAEYENDLQQVLNREAQLLASGHKFSFTAEEKIAWDRQYGEDFVKVDNHKVSNQQRIDALEIYVLYSSAFLKKYKGQFNLRNAQGFSTTTQLEAAMEKQIRYKLQLASVTAATLLSNPIHPPTDYGY